MKDLKKVIKIGPDLMNIMQIKIDEVDIQGSFPISPNYTFAE